MVKNKFTDNNMRGDRERTETDIVLLYGCYFLSLIILQNYYELTVSGVILAAFGAFVLSAFLASFLKFIFIPALFSVNEWAGKEGNRAVRVLRKAVQAAVFVLVAAGVKFVYSCLVGG